MAPAAEDGEAADRDGSRTLAVRQQYQCACNDVHGVQDSLQQRTPIHTTPLS